jgi:hypothetical protein
MGDKFYIFYCTIFFISFMSTLAAYVMLFSSSFAANIPLLSLGTCNIYESSGVDCRLIYTFWGILF